MKKEVQEKEDAHARREYDRSLLTLKRELMRPAKLAEHVNNIYAGIEEISKKLKESGDSKAIEMTATLTGNVKEVEKELKKAQTLIGKQALAIDANKKLSAENKKAIASLDKAVEKLNK